MWRLFAVLSTGLNPRRLLNRGPGRPAPMRRLWPGGRWPLPPTEPDWLRLFVTAAFTLRRTQEPPGSQTTRRSGIGGASPRRRMAPSWPQSSIPSVLATVAGYTLLQTAATPGTSPALPVTCKAGSQSPRQVMEWIWSRARLRRHTWVKSIHRRMPAAHGIRLPRHLFNGTVWPLRPTGQNWSRPHLPIWFTPLRTPVRLGQATACQYPTPGPPLHRPMEHGWSSDP